MSVSEQATMVTIPGIGEHLFSQSLVNELLVSIVATLIGSRDAFVILMEAVMGPKTIIESVWLLFASGRVCDGCGWTTL